MIAWKVRPDPWFIAVLATSSSHRRRGYARRLKHEVLARAQDAGADMAVSIVHEDNAEMLRLNRTLEARIVQDPEDGHYRICTIRLS